MKFIRKIAKKEDQTLNSKDAAKERLHLVLMQDRANVSADFLELMKQEIIEVIKKYIDVDETAIDVRLTNKDNGDGTKGAPALYANIPIVNIKDEVKQNSQISTENIAEDTKEETVDESTTIKKKVAEKRSKKNKEKDNKNDIEIQESKECIHEDQEISNEEVTVQKTEN